MSITPDGKMLYVPSLEKDALERRRRRPSGDVVEQIVHQERRPQHRRAASTAREMYLAGLQVAAA